jgi:hypothetical protein
MDPIAVELTLAETAARRRRALELASASIAVPLRLLALVWLALMPVALVVGRNHLGPFVAVALIAVTVAAWRRFRRAAIAHGVQARLWPWILVVIAATVGGTAASRGGVDHGLPLLNVVGPFAVNALALLALAWALRSRVLAATSGLMLAASGVVGATLTGNVAVAVQLITYAVLLLLACARLAR